MFDATELKIKNRTVSALRHQMTLSARSEVVWEVLADVEGWPRWTPTVRTVRALDTPKLGLGRRFALRQPLQRENVWRVTAFKHGRVFVWETDGPHGFKAGHAVDGSGEISHVSIWLRPKGATCFFWPIMSPLFGLALSREAAGLEKVTTAPLRRAISRAPLGAS